VMIEALACGTPVIAFGRGSVPEVIENGKTGFVVDDIEQAVEALERIDEIDRRVCRAEFERRFTSERIAQDYVSVYRTLIDAPRKAPAPLVPVRPERAPEARTAQRA